MWFKLKVADHALLVILLVFQYDPRFGDAFWNSTKYSILTYAFNVMTSWAIVCNVWYLPPMVKEVLTLLYILKTLVKHCLGGSLHYYAQCVGVTCANLYWSESNTVLLKLSEHRFAWISYLQAKTTLVEIQVFLHHAPSQLPNSSALGCSCLAFLCFQRLEEMLKYGFMLQDCWQSEPAPQPSPNLPFLLQKWYIHSGLHSILGCFYLLCLPPSAQLPPTSVSQLCRRFN